MDAAFLPQPLARAAAAVEPLSLLQKSKSSNNPVSQTCNFPAWKVSEVTARVLPK